MPAKFLYRYEGSDGEVMTQEFPFPDDEPCQFPPVGAIFIDAQGRSWTCLGPVQPEPAKEPA